MSDIALWLTKLGLEKYVSAFAEAEIDFADLPSLTDEDLKEVGLPVGPRRRVNEAIKSLDKGSESTTPEPEVSASRQSKPDVVSPSPSSDAERRHLTVMFVDLVGSTEMATRMDAEDMRDVITSYQNTVAGVVSRYEGFVAKFMGDGVLCYFGWPRANEDDAERAVRAGLSIIEAVKKTNAPNGSPLSTRVGIATGVVIVGDLIGSGATQEAAVVGETPNLAARLQGVAGLNQLVVAKETQRLLGTIFELVLLDGQDLKGISGPVDAYRVEGDATVQSRFAAHQSGAITPIVGREREIELMTERWILARSGQGQMVIVSGEAGIGKSRITQAVIDEVAREGHTRMSNQCSPYHANSAFYPIIQQMSFAAGFTRSDSPDVRLDKLEALLGADQDTLRLVAPLLGLDGVSRYGAVDLTPAQQRARTMQALAGLLVRLATEKPVLMVFEDLHWIDPTSLEFLDLLLDAITDQPIMILATARPTFEYGFGGHPIVTRFALNRLGKDQINDIVSKLTHGLALPDEILEVIAQRTDGVPLFVEELTKTILESGALKEDGDRLVLNGPLSAIAIPATLHDSLMARLDRLQPIKEVAQTAACIGREFGHGLLLQISSLADAELSTALEGLIDAKLIYRRGLPPESTYLFKHALVRDAAYESLLRENRRAVHTRILSALETDADIAPEILAIHAESANLTDRAINLWEAASKAAIARPAFDEAISHLRHAIALLSPQINDGTQAVLEQALGLQIQLGMALLYRIGYGADETKLAFEYALTLADTIGETPLRVPVLYGLWVNKYVRAQHADALILAQALVKLVEGGTDTAPVMLASRLNGVSLTFQGRFVEAQNHLARAHALFDPVVHKGLANRFGQDLGVAASCYMALNLWLLGETQLAKTHVLDAEHAALATGHINTICYMHCHVCLYALLAREDAVLQVHSAAMADISTEHSLTLWQDFARLMQALIDAVGGDETGIDHFMAADAHFIASKSQLFLAQFRIEAGFCALALGLVEKAQTLADMAHTLIDQTGETFALAELHRLEGALALTTDNRDDAEASLNAAVAVARKQGSKSLELRAAIDLANLRNSMGHSEEACTLLKRVHDSIAAGDCAEDSAKARAFLADHSM